MQPPLPSPFPTWHNAEYSAIDPTNPKHSAKGKVILITGGGAGIGQAVAHAFALAGATKIAILGRREQKLLDTKADLEAKFPGVDVYAARADVTDQAAIDAVFLKVANTFGNIDILVNNAGFQPALQPIKDAKLDDVWEAYEINVKGSIIVTKAFLRHASAKASLINFSTGVAHLPFMPGMSAYGGSKLAATKFFEYVQAENPDLQVINLAPGVIVTELQQKIIDAGIILPYDDIKLPAHFTVWAASPEAAFLKGKLIWCNWDIDELKAKKSELETTGFLTLGLRGFPEQ
ncbi:hypothetical protein BGW36DRAFT_388550 [Talaromyces proteolyticus]|uniref:Uncharacterized protein n=1 Tax=Talaromyces proteolyticus TaxID=1131652 RepID=A0AAD4KI00_9EURO|nr:uncharacterized protein BGW36DRAFT_388550 [Talaromyces proteolyticus]KAH8691549.1 hypothetical protein BGW36DRAFT_388550 [Talaromyces proteolyticus]